MVHLGCIALVLGAGLAGALLGLAGGRTCSRSRVVAPADDGAIATLHQQLAAAQAETTQLRQRIQTLETQLHAVLGRGSIITVDVRRSR
jgi:hypothetical protein